MSICFTGRSFLGPRRDDLTIYWALGPFVRSFILPVDPGDICPSHLGCQRESDARGREEGVTDQWGRAVRGWRGACGWALWAVEGEGGKRGRGAGWARMGPAEGGKGFSLFFVFYFLFSFFYFGFFLFSFSFESIIC
jgi:hypothetical protein